METPILNRIYQCRNKHLFIVKKLPSYVCIHPDKEDLFISECEINNVSEFMYDRNNSKVFGMAIIWTPIIKVDEIIVGFQV